RRVLRERLLVRGDDAAGVTARAARKGQVVIRALLLGVGEIAVWSFVDGQHAIAPCEADEVRRVARAEVGRALEYRHHARELGRLPDRPELEPVRVVVQ